MFATKKLQGSNEIFALLNVVRLPGRLSTGEVAAVLGFSEHDIPVLVAAKLLEPLGKPAANGPKYFASVDIVPLSNNREWLSRATRTLANYWRRKNARKGGMESCESNATHASPIISHRKVSRRTSYGS